MSQQTLPEQAVPFDLPVKEERLGADGENQSSSSCTLSQPQPDEHHKKAREKLMFFLKMNKDNKRKRAIMKWVKGVMQAIFNIVTFVPEIFFSYESRFNRAFTNIQTYAMLSSSRLYEAASTSFHFSIPLMVIFCQQSNEADKHSITSLLEQYEIGHFLNQSFLVSGLFDTDSDYKGNFEKFSHGQSGLYFFRADITQELENYHTLTLADVEKLEPQKVIDKLRKVRNDYYLLGQVDQEVRAQVGNGQNGE